MVLCFPLLLLIMLHTVMSSPINFKSCERLSFCVVSSCPGEVVGEEGQVLSWEHITTNTHTSCPKSVVITPLSPSSWEILLYGVNKLDNIVSCQGIIPNGQFLTSHLATITSTGGNCNILLKSKNGIQLSELLGPSRELTIDGQSSGISYNPDLASNMGSEVQDWEDPSLCNVTQRQCEDCQFGSNITECRHQRVEVKCTENKVLRLNNGQKTTPLLTFSPMILDQPLWVTAEGRQVTLEKGVCINKGTCNFPDLQLECGSNKCSSCKSEDVTTIWPSQPKGSNQTYGIEVNGLTCSNTTSMYYAQRKDGPNRTIVIGEGTKVSCMERVSQSATRSSLPTLHEKVASILLPLALLLALLMFPLLIHTRVRCIVTRYRHGHDYNHHAHITKELATNTYEVLSENQVDNTIQSRYTEPPKMTFGEYLRQLFTGFGKKDASSRKSESARKKTDDDDEKEKLLTARPPIAKCEVPTQPCKKEVSTEQSSSGPSVAQAPREPETKQEDGQPLSSKQLTSPSVSEKKKGSAPSSHTSNLTSSNSGGIPPVAAIT